MSRSTAGRPRRRFARLVTRTLALIIVLSFVSAAIGFQYWTDPATVRRLVLERLRLQFPGAEVSLDSARVWPGWGIAVTNLTLCRRDDPTLTPVLQVPNGRIEANAAQLARGNLCVGRVKLERARITAVRNRDGQWNLDGLLAPPQPHLPLPVVALERGTLVVRAVTPGGGESVWEMDGVRAALLEDRPGQARFECHGESARLGQLQLAGLWQRGNGDVDMTLELKAAPVNVALIQELARFTAAPIDSIQHIAGMAHVRLAARRRAAEAPAWSSSWRLGFSDGQLQLRELPIELTALRAEAEIADGRLEVKHAHALAADAPVEGSICVTLPLRSVEDTIQSADVSIQRLLVTHELFSRLPERMRRFHQRFAPVGRVSGEYHYARREAGGWDARIVLRPENAAGRYHKFPYPVRQAQGTIITELASEHAGLHSVDLSCEANGGHRVRLRGTVSGDEPCPAIDLSITAADGESAAILDVDEELIAALPPKFQPLARSFHFRGPIALTGRLHRAAGLPHGHDQYHLSCRDAQACYDLFPVPLEHVSGQLDIHLGPGLPDDPNRGDHWVLRNVRGVHGSGQVTLAARDEPASIGKRITIELGGDKLPLDESLARALARFHLSPLWETLAPRGAIDFTSRIQLNDRPDGPPDATVDLSAGGATIQPTFFPYALTDVTARLRSTPGRVVLEECTARHGPTQIRLGGGEVRTEKGVWVDLREVQANPLVMDADLIRAMPQAIRKACMTLEPKGGFTIDLKRLVLHDPPALPGPPAPPVLYWDGSLGMADASCTTGVTWDNIAGAFACRGAVRGNRLEWFHGHAAIQSASVLDQPLTKLHGQLVVDPATPEVLEVRNLTGQAYGGALTGEGRVTFGSGLDYNLDVKLLGGQLQEFGQHNRVGEGRLSGKATAQLYLAGRGTAPQELTGRGEIDVPAGKIYDLPLLLELLKATTLRAPDGVAFDEAHAVFKIQGRRMLVERLDLLGTAVSLGGRGSLDLNGDNVELDFYAVWARITQVLPAGWRELPPWVSQQLLRIRMRGSLDQPTYQAEPVPFVVEPVKQLLEQAAARSKPRPRWTAEKE